MAANFALRHPRKHQDGCPDQDADADEDLDADQDGDEHADGDPYFRGDSDTDSDKGLYRDTDRDSQSHKNTYSDPRLTMRDAFPVIPTPADLESLSEEVWRVLRDASVVAGANAQKLDAIAQEIAALARVFRGVVSYVRVAEEKRSASPKEQADAATALFAAIREADSGVRSLSAAELLGKLNLALAPAAGPES